mmetsp:Transcript_7645/g.13165  ORF Transcript_7645/g.13165 Transcript_7645/m.13165 type:complete len:264 (-) Transcript_7645:442-1233(-)|eukprot:CAMPEP_0198231328 /NCGR_PEP_ID=MMETSP1445-20131203/115133_1 /TAXON_ID=36898 /ORGANISM="Pyramimonas sp., Strain CCMP2087" /LENGTH=263 /DNA_ID=CAMNT_0043911937 /DNA_START=89 /DNA_END=880 /DNA_ORIENTATION=-
MAAFMTSSINRTLATSTPCTARVPTACSFACNTIPRSRARHTLLTAASPFRYSNTHRRSRANILVLASSEETSEAGDSRTIEFEAKIGQNVRQGMQGWDTIMTVKQPNPENAVASEGDDVTVKFTIMTEQGDIITSSEEEEPLTFEVGTRDFMGNPLFQGIDEAVRGVAIGETATIKASGGEYNPALLFKIPRNHPEVQRLEEETAAQGGLQEGVAVTLMNGQTAVVCTMSEEEVTIDANHPLAGSPLMVEVTLLKVEKAEKV